MLSKEFLNERGRNGSQDDEPAAAPAQTPDWLKNAGKYISNKIGLKEPVALPDYTASNQQDAAAKSGYTGIDPIQRQRAGMAPATQQEINRYMKDNPAVVGGLTDRNGNPIASGGAQEVERAARAAAPRRGADFDADAEVGAVDPAVIGNRFKTPNELGFQPGGSTAPTPAATPIPAAPSSVNTGGAGGVGGGGQEPGVQAKPVPSSTITPTELPPMPVKSFAEPAGAAPTPMKGGYGSGMNNPSVAPKATDPAAQYAAADAGRTAVKSSETNPELERMKTNAGISSTADAKSDIQPAPSFAGQTDEFGGMESPPAAQSANDGDAGEDLAKIKANAGLAQSANDDKAGEAQAATAAAPAMAAAPAAPAAAPVKAFAEPAAAVAPAHNPEADLDPAIMRARFDQEAAERAKPPAATPPPVRPGQQTSGTFGQQFKSARDQGLKTFSYQGKSYSTAMKGETPAAAKPAAPAPAAAKPAAPAPAAPAPAAPAKPAVKESQEINRMRFLAGLSKD